MSSGCYHIWAASLQPCKHQDRGVPGDDVGLGPSSSSLSISNSAHNLQLLLQMPSGENHASIKTGACLMLMLDLARAENMVADTPLRLAICCPTAASTQQSSMASMWWIRPDLMASLNLQTQSVVRLPSHPNMPTQKPSMASTCLIRPDLMASLNLRAQVCCQSLKASINPPESSHQSMKGLHAIGWDYAQWHPATCKRSMVSLIISICQQNRIVIESLSVVPQCDQCRPDFMPLSRLVSS